MWTDNDPPEDREPSRRDLLVGSVGAYAALKMALQRPGVKNSSIMEWVNAMQSEATRPAALKELAQDVLPISQDAPHENRQAPSAEVVNALNGIRLQNITPEITQDKSRLTITSNTPFVSGSYLCDFLMKSLFETPAISRRDILFKPAKTPMLHIKFPKRELVMPVTSVYTLMDGYVNGTSRDFWIFDSPRKNYTVLGNGCFIYSGLIESGPPENYLPEVIESFREHNPQWRHTMRAATQQR